jgi:Na+-translocating ferredoxin:NAD+ oxidoreductase subunit B
MSNRRPTQFDPDAFAPERLMLARIDEDLCIGCTLCVAACPVDAIVGAAKTMHTVLAGRCIGCELCLPPCPVDCIAMLATGRAWTGEDGARARAHVFLRNERLASQGGRRGRSAPGNNAPSDSGKARRRAAVAAALARARARRARNPRGAA